MSRSRDYAFSIHVRATITLWLMLSFPFSRPLSVNFLSTSIACGRTLLPIFLFRFWPLSCIIRSFCVILLRFLHTERVRLFGPISPRLLGRLCISSSLARIRVSISLNIRVFSLLRHARSSLCLQSLLEFRLFFPLTLHFAHVGHRLHEHDRLRYVYEGNPGNVSHVGAYARIVRCYDIAMLVRAVAFGVHNGAQTFESRQGLVEILVITASSLIFFGLLDQGLILGFRIVEVSHVTRCDHGLDLSAEDFV